MIRHRRAPRRLLLALLVGTGCLAESVLTEVGPVAATPADATTTEITGPTGSDGFGRQVLVLPNGNFVVADFGYDLPGAADVGAVFLYDGRTNKLISTLTGSTAGDQIGIRLAAVGNSNVVVSSEYWGNGAVMRAGAVTWMNGTSGLNGTVGAANSLVGTSPMDSIGSSLLLLANGNYVTGSNIWDNAGVTEAGALAWGNGNAGVSGAVSATNSLIGSHTGDQVGRAVITLTNGNYAVGAPDWDNGMVANVGAVTWGNGTAGTTGLVAPANSLIGTVAGDGVGELLLALKNGNYVVESRSWDNAMIANAGASTWRPGDRATTGVVSSANSLVGSTPGDNVGDAVALANGNYVVVASLWDNGATANVGAVTWANGGGGTVGAVTVANSFVGATNGDGPSTSVLALTNGNYVISNAFTDNGLIVDAGSATWRPGNAAAPGSPSITVSLLGGATNDLVGRYSVSLTNGNYVVASYEWNNGALQNAGAATWGSGTTGIAGLVSIGNSFVGTQPDESVGGNVIELVNGNFVLLTSSHDVGVLANVGSITWRPGDKAAAGSIDATNSMFGTAANDLVGFSQESLALPNGDYVVGSPYWDNGAAMNAGAVTVLPGGRASTGSVTAANSLVGGHTDDAIGNTLSLVNGAGFLVASSTWDNGALANAGAVTWVPGSAPTGLVSAENSNIGTIANGASGLRVDVNRLTANRSLVIGRPAQKVVALVTPTEYVPLAPARLADTRPGFTTVDNVAAGGGLVGAGTTLQVLVAGRGGVASGAVAAALNVTAVDAGGAGFVTVFPCGEARPTASTLNITAGSTVPNAVIAKLGTGGAICVFTTQPTHIVVDVNGFFPLVTSLRSLNPARVLDTRFGQVTIDGLQQGGGKNAAGSVLQLQVGGRAGVPADASAVALNVTVTEADVAAFVTVFPCGAPQPLASNLNVVPGVDVANLVVSRVGTNGTVCIFTSQAAHVVADVNGYFPATTGDRPLVPARLLETRAGSATIDGESNGAGLRPAGTVTIVRVVGRAGVPVGAGSVVVNLTVTEPAGPGFVTAYPCGIDPPLASTVNFTTGATVANAAIVKIGGGGAICVVNSQPTHLVLDVSGYLPA